MVSLISCSALKNTRPLVKLLSCKRYLDKKAEFLTKRKLYTPSEFLQWKDFLISERSSNQQPFSLFLAVFYGSFQRNIIADDSSIKIKPHQNSWNTSIIFTSSHLLSPLLPLKKVLIRK